VRPVRLSVTVNVSLDSGIVAAPGGVLACNLLA
jgi:hypothetical protein